MSTHPLENPRNEARQTSKKGIAFRRYFSKAGVDPYDELNWEKRSAVINDERGQPVFEQHDIEVPTTWSQTATNIVASKYFRGQLGSPKRESSVRVLISRVVDTIKTSVARVRGGPACPGLLASGYRESDRPAR
jgi:hypothetical protein